MAIYEALIGLCWLAFIVVWFVSAFTAKRNARNGWLRQTILIRVIILAIVILALEFWRGPTREQALRNFGSYGVISNSPAVAILGVFLCALGVAFAIWARMYLGRNWGMPMTLKQDPELVQTGPYAYVRHPIYSGMLLAMLGSVLGDSILWLIPLFGAAVYFIYSAKTEEGIMIKQFPEAYPGYMKRTKMLIPFISLKRR